MEYDGTKTKVRLKPLDISNTDRYPFNTHRERASVLLISSSFMGTGLHKGPAMKLTGTERRRIWETHSIKQGHRIF
jgi:hypothetical protein